MFKLFCVAPSGNNCEHSNAPHNLKIKIKCLSQINLVLLFNDRCQCPKFKYFRVVMYNDVMINNKHEGQANLKEYLN